MPRSSFVLCFVAIWTFCPPRHAVGEHCVSAAIAEVPEAPSLDEDVAVAEPIPIEVDRLDPGLTPEALRNFTRARLPERILRLHGCRVQVRGYMYPTYEETGITEFILSGETQRPRVSSPYNSPPAHRLFSIILKNGTTTDYLENKRMLIEGTLRIVPEIHDGTLLWLFRIENAIMRPAEWRRGYHNPLAWMGC